MNYTVAQLAKLSGVSIRSLHWYDKIGLLKPAYYGTNGYRYYDHNQLLILQQILFFKELDFDLKQIQKILHKNDFDKILTLNSHKKVLQKKITRYHLLIKTIEKTVEHLKGVKKMKDQEIYQGFNKAKQQEYQDYLINRFGEKAKDSIKESNEKLKNWTKEDFAKSKDEFGAICQELASFLKNQLEPSSPNVQKIIRKHYEWLKNYWTPNHESYIALGNSYTAFEWKKAFEPYDKKHPKLALYLARAIEIFANKNL